MPRGEFSAAVGNIKLRNNKKKTIVAHKSTTIKAGQTNVRNNRSKQITEDVIHIYTEPLCMTDISKSNFRPNTVIVIYQQSW